MKDDKIIPCNQIAVTEASKGGIARHHFAIEDKCQEVGIQEMLMKLCMQDFVEPKTTKDEICDALQEVSYEDKKFIKMMNEETEIRKILSDNTAMQKQGGPNNRRLAESGLVGTKRRMLRDMHYAL